MKDDGSIVAWGSNECGQLGNGGSVSSATAVAVDDEDYVQLVLKVDGRGAVQGPESALVGRIVTVRATPAEHAEFIGWYSGNELVGNDPELTFRAKWDTSLTAKFKMVYNLSDAVVDSVGDVEYTGKPATPKPKVSIYGDTLVEGVDFSFGYESNVKPGTGKLTITGIGGDCHGKTSRTFRILPASVTTVSLEKSKLTYTGKGLEPKVAAVKAGGNSLTTSDYDVSYKNNVNAGTATVTVAGKGNYTGTASTTFKIKPASINAAGVALSSKSFTYDGKAKTPSVKSIGGNALSERSDCILSYKNNVNAGTVTVTVAGKGNYTGTASTTFKIKPLSISGSKLGVSKVKFTYSGKVQRPLVKTVGGKVLKENADFTACYPEPNSKRAGKYYVYVKGKGNYAGESLKAQYRIAKATNSVSAKGKTLTVDSGSIVKKAKSFKASKAFKVNKAKGKVSYKVVKRDKKAKKRISVTKNGTVKVGKGLPSGTYWTKVKVTAAGTANYEAKSKTVTLKIVVRSPLEGSWVIHSMRENGKTVLSHDVFEMIADQQGAPAMAVKLNRNGTGRIVQRVDINRVYRTWRITWKPIGKAKCVMRLNKTTLIGYAKLSRGKMVLYDTVSRLYFDRA